MPIAQPPSWSQTSAPAPSPEDDAGCSLTFWAFAVVIGLVAFGVVHYAEHQFDPAPETWIASYSVKKDDNLTVLAETYRGKRTQAWFMYWAQQRNNLDDPGKIYPRQRLDLPDGRTPTQRAADQMREAKEVPRS